MSFDCKAPVELFLSKPTKGSGSSKQHDSARRQFEHPRLQRGGFDDPLDSISVHFEIEKAALKFCSCRRQQRRILIAYATVFVLEFYGLRPSVLQLLRHSQNPAQLAYNGVCYFKGTRTIFGRKRNDYLYYPRKRRRSLIGRADASAANSSARLRALRVSGDCIPRARSFVGLGFLAHCRSARPVNARRKLPRASPTSAFAIAHCSDVLLLESRTLPAMRLGVFPLTGEGSPPARPRLQSVPPQRLTRRRAEI
jgi:hypothetical protein